VDVTNKLVTADCTRSNDSLLHLNNGKSVCKESVEQKKDVLYDQLNLFITHYKPS